MVAPIALIQATIDGMIERGFGRVINITSAAVKAPIGVLALSNGARAGQTGFVAGLARQVARHNVTINNLLRGLFDTDRLAQLTEAQATASDLSSVRSARFWPVPKQATSPDRTFFSTGGHSQGGM